MIILILSIALNVFLLYKYIPIWLICHKEAQIDKKIAAEIATIDAGNEELIIDQSDLKDLLPSPEELDDLLDEEYR